MSSETFFVIFAVSLSAPLWLLKRQDIYVSFTNFWSLVSTDGGKKWKTEQPPHNIKWVSGLGRRARTWHPPNHPTVQTGSSGSALPAGAMGMAEPGFRVFCWLCWSLTEGRQPNKLAVIFPEVPAVQVLLFQVLKIHPRWCCSMPCALVWWLPTVLGEVRRAQASGSYWVFAGSVSALPKATAFLSVTGFKNRCLETFHTQVLLHFSPAFVFTRGCSLLRTTFDLPRGLEVISFGASLSPWMGGRDHQKFLISFESGCSWSKNKKHSPTAKSNQS